MIFKPLAFGSFGEMSSNVRELIEMAMKYGVEHLGNNVAAASANIVGSTMRRRYKTQLSLEVWRGYANLLLDMTRYVGTLLTTTNMAHIGMEMGDKGDSGAHGHL
jgi:hypothetical protein